MEVTAKELREHYSQLPTEELISLWNTGELTELAKNVLEGELTSRGLDATAPLEDIPSLEEIDKAFMKEKKKRWRRYRLIAVVTPLLGGAVIMLFFYSYFIR